MSGSPIVLGPSLVRRAGKSGSGSVENVGSLGFFGGGRSVPSESLRSWVQLFLSSTLGLQCGRLEGFRLY